MRSMLFTSLLLIACTGGSGSTSRPDAPAVAVTALSSCPAFVDATVMDSPSTFVPPMSTVPIGGIVKFEITAEHYVIPNPGGNTDPAFMVSRGETKCFRFGVTGTYTFVCGVHGFVGTITVQ